MNNYILMMMIMWKQTNNSTPFFQIYSYIYIIIIIISFQISNQQKKSISDRLINQKIMSHDYILITVCDKMILAFVFTILYLPFLVMFFFLSKQKRISRIKHPGKYIFCKIFFRLFLIFQTILFQLQVVSVWACV